MKKRLFFAILIMAVVATSLLGISWKNDTPPGTVKVQSIYNSSNTSSDQQLRDFIQTNHIEKENIISVSNSAAFVPNQGIYHTYLLIYKK